MIDRLVVENFKSLRRVDLKLGRFNLLIGANASGKSNFLDALRVLQGIGHGFAVDEIFGGKPKSATGAAWSGIRGGSTGACFAGRSETEDPDARPVSDEVQIEASGKLFITTSLPLESRKSDAVQIEASGKPGVPRALAIDNMREEYPWRFSTVLTPRSGRVASERFDLVGHPVYDTVRADRESHSVRYFSGKSGQPPDLSFAASRPVLGQFTGQFANIEFYRHYMHQLHADAAAGLEALLANVQHAAHNPERLRSYSDVRAVRRMGDHGENFAALVRTICQDAETKDDYLSWLRQLRPEDVDDVGVLSGAVGEPLFMLREGGREFPAPVLSDGTLRFAAITAAFFQPDMPALMTIEEIENGVHASRVKTLLELLRGQAETAGTQVVATTHSPTVLDWLEEDDYKTTFLFRRDDATGESKVRSLADVPRFMDVVGKKPVSELFSEGWLEVAS